MVGPTLVYLLCMYYVIIVPLLEYWHAFRIIISMPALGFEGLRSKAFWSAEDFDSPWVTAFQKGFLDVKEELLALRGRGGFQVRATMPSASREYTSLAGTSHFSF